MGGPPRGDYSGTCTAAVGGGIQVDAEVVEDEQHSVKGDGTVAAFEAGEGLAGDSDGVGDVLLGEVPLDAGVLDQTGGVPVRCEL